MNKRHTFIFAFCLIAAQLCLSNVARAENGYRLWLRYAALPVNQARVYRRQVSEIIVQGTSPTLAAARDELVKGCAGLLAAEIPHSEKITRDGAVVIGTPQSSPLIASLNWTREISVLGHEGFLLRSARLNGRKVTVIAARDEIGALYGAFHFLRLLQTLQPINNLNLRETPRIGLRTLDHWDNLDGSIERGYAGRSLWNWAELPDKVDPRLTDYARANASVGINGATLNNVNANAQSLTPEYLQKTAAIANAFRPYGVRVYLSARFSAPIEIGGLKTADPLDPQVAAWWKNKADEIYKLIPDFGGFLVKANSEGQSGPRTYNRSHADGANMLAAAVAPHNGIVMWRAFVYDAKPGYDRAAAAYDNLQPFDGKFAPNVLLQVKYGAIDFQPREPFHPLFGAMPRTQLMPELQLTQEYLGFSNHLVFLAPLWREILDSDTYSRGKNSTVARVADGSLYQQKLTGIAGVANTGSDRNWTGHDFAQANWYAFGRLAWNHALTPSQIAAEWTAQTFTHDAATAQVIARILLQSHEAAVNYMTPLGLHHIMWGGHHYGPAPWWDKENRPDWNPVYYHRANVQGIGFDRTVTGSNAVSQYNSPVRERFANLKTCPEKYLLWFHHISWDYRLDSGKTLWDELALHYQNGVDWMRRAKGDWASLQGKIDDERHAAVAHKLMIQARDAVWWKDAGLTYFQTFARRELPRGVEKPEHKLVEYQTIDLWDTLAQDAVK